MNGINGVANSVHGCSAHHMPGKGWTTVTLVKACVPEDIGLLVQAGLADRLVLGGRAWSAVGPLSWLNAQGEAQRGADHGAEQGDAQGAAREKTAGVFPAGSPPASAGHGATPDAPLLRSTPGALLHPTLPSETPLATEQGPPGSPLAFRPQGPLLQTLHEATRLHAADLDYIKHLEDSLISAGEKVSELTTRLEESEEALASARYSRVVTLESLEGAYQDRNRFSLNFDKATKVIVEYATMLNQADAKIAQLEADLAMREDPTPPELSPQYTELKAYCDKLAAAHDELYRNYTLETDLRRNAERKHADLVTDLASTNKELMSARKQLDAVAMNNERPKLWSNIVISPQVRLAADRIVGSITSNPDGRICAHFIRELPL